MTLRHQTKYLRLVLPILLAVALVVTVIGTTRASGVPIINIQSVVPDKSVTIYGYNFPTNQTFTVRMGQYGTFALGGTVVGTKETGSNSTFTATFDIPAGLVGQAKIAIRLDSPQGYYSYNWFGNKVTTATSTGVSPTSTAATKTPVSLLPGYYGYPTFNIAAVVKNTSVTVVTYNLPAGQKFTVRMGEYGTKGLGGIEVGTFDSGSGGSLTQTYTIPASLADRPRIAIRMDCALGYYAFNWFWNNTATVQAVTPGPAATTGPTATATPVGTPAPTATTVPIVPGYVGIPTFSIAAVVKDVSVTINANNFPAGQTFTVKMGEYGTQGIGGIVVDSVASGSGGSFTKTFAIPAALAGRYKIAIRLETSNGYYYAYNWFYNNTTN